MDDKSKFQKIQAKLERYLYEYKNCYPKNVWQILGIDIPLVTLLVSSFVVIKLMGICLVSIILLILIILPTVLIWSSDSNSIWTKLIKKRRTYRVDSQNIIDQINAIDTKEFDKYPDVKKYMDDTIKFAYAHGYVETLYGRKRYLSSGLLSTNGKIQEVPEAHIKVHMLSIS